MLLNRLMWLWLRPANDGISATIARRTVFALWLCAMVCYAIISPFIASEHTRQQLSSIGLYGEMLCDLLHNQDQGYNLSPKVLDKYGIDGIYRAAESQGKPGQFIMFSERAILDQIDTTYELEGATWWARIPSAMSIIFSDSTRFIRIVGLENDDGPRVDVFVQKSFVKARLEAMFINAFVIGILMFVITHFAVWAAVQRYVGGSLSAMLASLYGNTNASKTQNGSSLGAKLVANHAALEAHVNEQARLASLGAATGRLAHDIRNLLASLLLISERFVAMESEAESKLGKRMQSSVSRALTLCDWASRYTSVKRDQVIVSEQSLAPLVDEVLSFVKLHDPRGRVDLINAVDPDFTVLAERTLLFRILFNIALNAVQAMQNQKSRGFLTVSVRKTAQSVEIELTDGGPGINASEALSALEPHNGRPSSTGLGMTIAADLARWHGGSLELVRSDSLGASFRVILPLVARKSEEALEIADIITTKSG